MGGWDTRKKPPYNGHIEIVKILWEYMSKVLRIPSNDLLKFVNSQDKKRGMTALHMACDKGHSEVVEYLVFSVKMDKNGESLEKNWNRNFAKQRMYQK